jgi:hypothetical protein
LLELGAELESRDLSTGRLTEAGLEGLVGQRDYKEFLNPRNEPYRTHPPSRGEAIGTAGQRAQSVSQGGADSPLTMVLRFDEEA